MSKHQNCPIKIDLSSTRKVVKTLQCPGNTKRPDQSVGVDLIGDSHQSNHFDTMSSHTLALAKTA